MSTMGDRFKRKRIEQLDSIPSNEDLGYPEGVEFRVEKVEHDDCIVFQGDNCQLVATDDESKCEEYLVAFGDGYVDLDSS